MKNDFIDFAKEYILESSVFTASDMRRGLGKYFKPHNADKTGRSPSMGASGAGSDRWAIISPTCGTGGLNLVLDVLAKLLDDALDVLCRAVISKRP